MNFLISIIAAIILVVIGRDFIKKHATLCYLLTTLLYHSYIFFYLTKLKHSYFLKSLNQAFNNIFSLLFKMF